MREKLYSIAREKIEEKNHVATFCSGMVLFLWLFLLIILIIKKK